MSRGLFWRCVSPLPNGPLPDGLFEGRRRWHLCPIFNGVFGNVFSDSDDLQCVFRQWLAVDSLFGTCHMAVFLYLHYGMCWSAHACNAGCKSSCVLVLLIAASTKPNANVSLSRFCFRPSNALLPILFLPRIIIILLPCHRSKPLLSASKRCHWHMPLPSGFQNLLWCYVHYGQCAYL